MQGIEFRQEMASTGKYFVGKNIHKCLRVTTRHSNANMIIIEPNTKNISCVIRQPRYFPNFIYSTIGVNINTPLGS